MSNDALFIFIKNSGEVKSRIASDVGKSKAISIYEELLDSSFDLANEVKNIATIYLYFTEENKEERWSVITSHQHCQIEGDLGEKMADAFRTILPHHQRVVLIGSDCPYLRISHITESFDLLSLADVVIGPAIDGGYYLIGMSHPLDNIFRNIPWSTEYVYQKTVDQLYDSKLTFATLERLADIDYYQDYQQWKSKKD